MSVELPFAPVDDIIRREAGSLRVGSGATEELARWIQRHGAGLAVDAAERATVENRKTIMAADFGVETVPDPGVASLPIAPVDRIARIKVDDRYRIGEDARVALAVELEDAAAEVAAGAATLAEHAGRRTVQSEDVRTYLELVE
jgi:histone H3/H4